MSESERLERYKEHRCYHDSADGDLEKEDQELADRISALLDHPMINKHCMVDAYYYDFSVIPREIKQNLQLWRDCYLIFGITTEGEIISKWVDRWDLDSPDPIVGGKVIPQPRDNKHIPEIKQTYNAQLLSTPVSNVISNLFGKI